MPQLRQGHQGKAAITIPPSKPWRFSGILVLVGVFESGKEEKSS